MKKYNR